MEVSKKDRVVRRAIFTKKFNELDLLLSSEGKCLSSIKVVWEILQQKYSELQIVDEKIYNMLLEDVNIDEATLAEEMERTDEYLRKFTKIKVRIDELNAEDKAQSEQEVISGISQPSNTSKRKFKLPVIEFKRFNGDVREWLGFWAQFRKIHEDPDIDEHDKIIYLIQATEIGSKARLVESYPAMQENYSQIIDSLKARFGREDILIEVYVRELLKLILKNTTSQEKTDISTLYDKVESYLRALETLGITKNKCAPMLFPLIESCLPENLLRAWQRCSQYTQGVTLEDLWNFLKAEVESEQRISMANESFGFNTTSDKKQFRSDRFKQKCMNNSEEKIATASGLVNFETKCVFCEASHDAQNCSTAKRFSFTEKKETLSKKGACYKCLKVGHVSRKCHAKVRCLVCDKTHVTLMCPEIISNRSPFHQTKVEVETKPTSQVLACQTASQVFMQTIMVTLSNGLNSRKVRALMDTGSQRLYILKSTAQELGLVPLRTVILCHALFGGKKIAEQPHNCYKVKISNQHYSCHIEVLDQHRICSDIEPIYRGEWYKELAAMNIHISDVGESGAIEILFGADVIGNFYTGRRHVLKSGLVAIDTLLWWTLMGKVLKESNSSLVISMLIQDASISNLWELDILGITDPTETKNREELALNAKKIFEETVIINEEGRYEVQLPWIEEHLPLPSNYTIAKKRLQSTLCKLQRDGLVEDYYNVFKEWLQEGIIEQIPMDELKNDGHYLPHRAVIKENSTTKIRPVFDASSCEKGKPSLNSCLEVGPNLIESIPSILLRFRMFKFGIISDIRKAFLQISLNPKVRDFLRFLWIGENGEDIIFRHKRVVFGVKSSPFLLGATIEHHLNECKKKCMNLDKPLYRLGTINKLSESFYVDNCVTSVEEEHYVNRFIQEAKVIMNEGCFDLRGWEYTRYETQESKPFPVLGLSWYTSSDVLSICDGCILEMPDKDLITKRKILSISQKVFDPIGFTCPASLYPKLILQKTWEDKLGWDDPVQPEYSRDFIKWVKNVHLLLTIKIPRCINWGSESSRSYSLHMFCDASKEAYAAVVYLRVKEENQVCIYLLAAKARVAPLKKMTIPRLELLAATIGARLFNSLKIQLDRKLDCFCWSDSSTVLCWIRRTEEWSVFIRNRIEEIRMLTSECTWRHIPGSLNPADLPSRGCTIKQLISSKWWEGPIWLYEEPELWLNDFVEYDEEEVNKERKKKSVPTLMKIDSIDWHLNYFSKYNKTLRMMAWIFRFKYNVENKPKLKGMLSIEEIQRAEIFILKTIQAEYFQDIHDKQICTLNPFYDEYGLIRLKSRISQREDIKDFCFPILLPAKNHVVSSLIFEVHVNACHVGIQALLSILRENYWILGGRKTIRSVLSKCSVCRRLNSKHFEVNPSILPLNRVNDAAVFEVTGVDFAGPLILKNGDKAWICLFTCAVYRAIHLELSTSVSTPAFLQVLRRFIARRGRPKIIYSDNGTNFVGTENYFEKLDWDHINLFSSAQRIKWYFNPPTAAWWGGFWERLIGLLKQLLRKVLQRARLTFEELMTVICREF